MSSSFASGGSKGMGWTGKDETFVDQIIDIGLKQFLDDETEYDVFVGKGGPGCNFYHHYIVVESPVFHRIILELSKTRDYLGRMKVVPNVRKFSSDSDPDYKITVKTTLRWLAELASKVILLLGPYNLITASCQTFSDEFLKQLGSGGYMTYVKTATTVAAVAGVVAVGAGLLYWLSSGEKKEKKDTQ